MSVAPASLPAAPAAAKESEDESQRETTTAPEAPKAPKASPGGAATATNGAGAVEGETALSRFEAQWEKFNNMFTEMMGALGRGLTNMGVVSGPPDSNLTPEEKAAVFEGQEPSLELICKGIREGKYKHIVVCCGAGISTSAGIPDYRTPGTGLMDTLMKQYGDELKQKKMKFEEEEKWFIPKPESLFSIDFFLKNPYPFVNRCAALWPSPPPGTAAAAASPPARGSSTLPKIGARATTNVASTTTAADSKHRPQFPYKPTPTHMLLKLLCDMGVVQRIFTQNIDSIELMAGVPKDRLFQCHGHLRSVTCTRCGGRWEQTPTTATSGKAPTNGQEGGEEGEDTYESIVHRMQMLREPARCKRCPQKADPDDAVPTDFALIKPDIVMYGESLRTQFGPQVEADLKVCDLVLVMGTALAVRPVSTIPDQARASAPRVLVNRELVGDFVRTLGTGTEKPAEKAQPAYPSLPEAPPAAEPPQAPIAPISKPETAPPTVNYRDVAVLGELDASSAHIAAGLDKTKDWLSLCVKAKVKNMPTASTSSLSGVGVRRSLAPSIQTGRTGGGATTGGSTTTSHHTCTTASSHHATTSKPNTTTSTTTTTVSPARRRLRGSSQSKQTAHHYALHTVKAPPPPPPSSQQDSDDQKKSRKRSTTTGNNSTRTTPQKQQHERRSSVSRSPGSKSINKR